MTRWVTAFSVTGAGSTSGDGDLSLLGAAPAASGAGTRAASLAFLTAAVVPRCRTA